MSFRLRVRGAFSFVLCVSLCLGIGCAAVGGAQTIVHDLFAINFGSPARLTRLNGQTGAVVYSVPAGGYYVRQGPDGLLYTQGRRVDPATGIIELHRAYSGIGFDFGADGNVYAGSGTSVAKFNPATGARLGTFVPFGSGGVQWIEAVRFGPDGNLYVTEPTGTAPTGSRVMRYNGTTGAFMGVFASDARLVGPRSLDWGPNGNLYVAGIGSDFSGPGNGRVLEFNGVTGAFERVIAEGLQLPNGLAFGPDGNLYVGLESEGTIKRYHGTTGAFIDDFATGLPPSMVGITWATILVPEPNSAVLTLIALRLLRKRRATSCRTHAC
jgi:hypothetical protein